MTGRPRAPRRWVGFMARAGVAVAGLVALGPAPAWAQTPDETWRIDLRDDVEVCERGLRTGSTATLSIESGRRWDRGRCTRGEARLRLVRDRGRIVEVELEPLPRDSTAVMMLGSRRASDLLLGLARDGSTRADAAETGIMVSTLLSGVDVWPRVLGIARDRSVEGEIREAAVFWLGQGAAEAVTGDLSALAREPDEDDEVREAAVFALSQRPPDQGVPALVELVRTSEHGAVRRSALFWLAQSGDPRALDLFQEILVPGRGG